MPPDLPPAAVERGAKALGPFIEGVGHEIFQAMAEAVLTAALRLDDPEMIDRVARWLCTYKAQWNDLQEWQRDYWREDARRLFAEAIWGAEPEEANDD